MKFGRLVVGLGNPEGKYFGTYHNLGFAAAEKLAAAVGAEFKKKGNQLLAPAAVEALILKPLTYMNLSGQAVLAAVRKHKIAPENIAVLVDDLYIEKGHIRVSFGGSGGGHNGLKSITELLGTNQYLKIRIGIKPAKDPGNNAAYVLSKIDPESRGLLDGAVERAAEAAIAFINGETVPKLQGKYNAKNTAQ
jgi:PTH1 family peptidyl-tRNA hydrolase